MTRLVCLRKTDGDNFHVNPDAVQGVKRQGSNTAVVYLSFVEDGYIVVMGDADEVAQEISETEGDRRAAALLDFQNRNSAPVSCD